MHNVPYGAAAERPGLVRLITDAWWTDIGKVWKELQPLQEHRSAWVVFQPGKLRLGEVRVSRNLRAGALKKSVKQRVGRPAVDAGGLDVVAVAVEAVLRLYGMSEEGPQQTALVRT